MNRALLLVLGILAGVVIGGALLVGGAFLFLSGTLPISETYTIERTDYQPTPPDPWQELIDDKQEDKNPTFDPALIDRRKLGEWLLNASAAVIKLDVVAAKPDQDAELLKLHPSYADTVKAARKVSGLEVLPSVNLIDGKAKQFDDGLYAALDQAYYVGLEGTLRGHVQLVKALMAKVGPDSPAAPFLAAALELAGEPVVVTDVETKKNLLQSFEAVEVFSKPIGVYTWNDNLKKCFRFLRFLQKEFGDRDLAVPVAMAQAVAGDPVLLADTRKVVSFFSNLTNPPICLAVTDILEMKTPDPALRQRLSKERGLLRQAVALFPASTARETVLFEKLFPNGLPPDADLMKELIRAIRSGNVDLKPGKDSGWYAHQVYALETLLLPEKGPESQKLLLTKAYKKRMLEAFQVLMTKRRETHVRQLGIPMAGSAAPGPPELPTSVRPRLRVEPAVSYYLRTARAYAFLANFLEASVGIEGLQRLHGLKQDGQRKPDLHTELMEQRDLFYGLYLVSCEDVGLKPALLTEEEVNEDRCYKLATEWVSKAFADPDLACDTRVSVPIMIDPMRGVTRLWVTLGVRLAKLDADYARAPSIRPANDPEMAWKAVDVYTLERSHYLIPVEEFAEVELRGLKAINREELRAICDREKTKDAIVAALRAR